MGLPRIPIAENLKAARESRGISQVRLAELSGISRKTINGIECHRVPKVSMGTIITLCRALDVKLEHIVLMTPKGKGAKLRQ